MIKNLFFDFDGVIKESGEVKTEAFRSLYSEFGTEVSDRVVEHHLLNGGVSRYVKIAHYHKAFLGIELSDSEIEKWASSFSDKVLDAVVNAPYVRGAFEFIQSNSKIYRCFIISGTPEEELLKICSRLNLNEYFQEIHGSPKNKKTWLDELLPKYDLNKSESLFIGDALTDYEAARHAELHFYLREHEENTDHFKDIDCFKSSDMTDLQHFIQMN